MAEAFVYCWSDMKTDMLYIGFHKGSVDDGYICSSKYMMEEYKSRPNDFKRNIVASGSIDDMLSFESLLLKTLDARNDSTMYNMHNGDGKFIIKCRSKESRKKQSETMLKTRKALGITLSKEHREYLSKIKTGVPRSKESRKKQSESVFGSKNHFYGKTHSEEFKKKQSLRKKKTQCGSGNTNAKSVKYGDKIYLTMKEMSVDMDLSMYHIRKMIKSGQAELYNGG
jgi:hypothetical protein